MTDTITPEELKERLAGDGAHAALDVREPMEFHAGQIPGTTNLPRGWLEFRIAGLVPVRDTPVALIGDDRTGRAGRAKLAAETLARHGWGDVRTISIDVWKNAGFGVITGTNVPSKLFGEQVLREDRVPEIGAEALHALIESGAPLRIFDARTESEFERFSIPKGVSLPGGELILHALDLGRENQGHLIVNCAGRTRSIIGAAALRRLGVGGARALKNGGMGFILADIPLDHGKKCEIPEPSEESRRHGEALAARLAEEEGIPHVSAEELRGLMDNSGRETLYVLDVRLGPEHAAGRIPGSISIPGGQAVQRTDEVVAVRAGAVVTYCSGSARGTMAAYWLRRMGLPNVSYLRGGLAAWEAAGFSVEASPGGGGAEGTGGGESPALSPASETEPLGLAEAREAARGVSPGEAEELMRGDAAVFDVDLSVGFKKGHIRGSSWRSRARLEEGLSGASGSPGVSGSPGASGSPGITGDSPVLFVCADGRRSALSAGTLSGMGHEALFIEGGKRAWREAGLPLEAGDRGFEGPALDVALKPYDIGRGAMQEYLTWEENLGKE